ncbi:MAG: response regulator transcription factor [Saprospiraceae bacterium]|nr:response regulator transcription factor [Saprospiraceae bacterium]
MYIIVEDEPLASERAKDYIKKLPFLDLLATFDNATDALVFLKMDRVDLLFLDIHLGTLSGIQLLETASLSCQVILTTAYHEYALKGFDLKVADYLLKPYTFERFVQAVERVEQHFAKTEPNPEKRFIFVKIEYRLEKVFLDDILFIEGKGNYRRIHTRDKKLMTLQTFSELDREIRSRTICRVHKSYMVAIDKIDSIEKDRIKIQDVYIPVSETYRQAFFDRIQS